MNFPDHLAEKIDANEENDIQLRVRLSNINSSLDAFWNRWRQEYLLELREPHRHFCSNGEPQISKGDVVLVHSDDQPRSCWRLGIFEQLIVGADGHV